MKQHFFAALLTLLLTAAALTIPATASAFQLHNYQTGLCLSAAGASAASGTKFVTWTCDWHIVDRSQRFGEINVVCPAITPCNFLDCDQSDWYNCFFETVGPTLESFQEGGVTTIYDLLGNVICTTATTCASSTVLGIAGGGMKIKNGANVVQVVDSQVDLGDRWTAVYAVTDNNGQDCYYFENSSGMQFGQTYVLGVQGGALYAGAPVVVWQLFRDWHGNPDIEFHPDQYWCVY